MPSRSIFRSLEKAEALRTAAESRLADAAALIVERVVR